MNGPDLCETLDVPADLLQGCVETGGSLQCEDDRLEFTAGSGEVTEVVLREIVEMRLGGRHGVDANRIDLRVIDGRTFTFLVVGRERVASLVLERRGWEHAGLGSGV